MIQWDHIETAFVEVTVWLETSSLPDNLRPYLELFLEVLFELPVRQDDGTLWTHEEVGGLLDLCLEATQCIPIRT